MLRIIHTASAGRLPGSLELRAALFASLLLSATAMPSAVLAQQSVQPATQTTAVAEADGRHAQLRWLLEQSGISGHLAFVADSITADLRQALARCPQAAAPPPWLASRIHSVFAAGRLMPAVLQTVDAQLTRADVASVRHWMLGPAGTRVRTAESAVNALDETAFKAARQRLLAAPDWTPQRAGLIAAVVRATAAGAFVTAFNTGISAAVHTAATCPGDAADFEAVAKVIASERRDESFYAAFMNRQLIVPTAVVFESLSDAELQDYLAFSRSPAGAHYHQVLIEATRTGLYEGVAKLRDTLQDR